MAAFLRRGEGMHTRLGAYGIVLAVSCVLAACVPVPSTSIDVVSTRPSLGQATNILVVYSITKMSESELISRLTTRQAACGVASKHVTLKWSYDAFNRPDPDKIRAEGINMAAGFKADAILNVVEKVFRYEREASVANLFAPTAVYAEEFHDDNQEGAVWKTELRLFFRGRI